MTKVKELEIAMIKAGISKSALSNKLGISKQCLYNKFNNRSEFKSTEIAIISKTLGLSNKKRDEIFLLSK